MSVSARAEKTIETARIIEAVLRRHSVECALIGAAAVAAHGYPRYTEDFDLATDADPFTSLKGAAADLVVLGYVVEFNLPDRQDPLGGLIRVTGDDFAQIDVVNFHNPYTAGFTLGLEAVRGALAMQGSPFKVVSLPYLIALKLYAGGGKSMTDVIELVERRPDLDLIATREICRRHGLLEPLERVLTDLGRV